MEPKTWQHRYLNAFVVYFLVGPVMGVAWNCIWFLLSNNIIYPEDPEASIWISCAIGYPLGFVAFYFQDEIYKFATSHGYFFFFVFSRFYTYAMFFVSGNAWRAVWEGMDYYTEISEKNALISGASAYGVLLLLRCSRQVVFAPCVLRMELPIENFFVTESYFGHKKPKGLARLGDSIFSLLIIVTLGFVVWRGVWQYMDVIIFPDDHSTSGFVSLGISYGIMVVFVVIEPLAVSLNKNLYSTHYLLGLICEDVIIFFYIIASINFWRGFGLVFEVYVPTETLRYWLGHYVCCFILFFTMAFNSVIAIGCAIEGVETDGSGAKAGIEYLDHFSQIWRAVPDSMRKSKHKNIFTLCTQAWRNDKVKEESGRVVPISSKPVNEENPQNGADAIQLVTVKHKPTGPANVSPSAV